MNWRGMYVFRNRKWFFDKVYNEFVTQAVRHHAYHTTYKRVDRGLIERLGPHGISTALALRSEGVTRFHTGEVSRYLVRTLRGVLALRGLTLWTDGLGLDRVVDPRRSGVRVVYGWFARSNVTTWIPQTPKA